MFYLLFQKNKIRKLQLEVIRLNKIRMIILNKVNKRLFHKTQEMQNLLNKVSQMYLKKQLKD